MYETDVIRKMPAWHSYVFDVIDVLLARGCEDAFDEPTARRAYVLGHSPERAATAMTGAP